MRTSRKLLRACALACVLPTGGPLPAQQAQQRAYVSQATPQTPAPKATPAAAPAASPDTAHGERVFQNNCSRCHQAPQEFSPRITGTVIRHMRVRANISEADEKALLHFLAP